MNRKRLWILCCEVTWYGLWIKTFNQDQKETWSNDKHYTENIYMQINRYYLLFNHHFQHLEHLHANSHLKYGYLFSLDQTSKQTTLKVIHVYGENQTYRARISLSLSFSICITKTIFSIASLCDFREMRVWFLLLRGCRLCVSPQNSSRWWIRSLLRQRTLQYTHTHTSH